MVTYGYSGNDSFDKIGICQSLIRAGKCLSLFLYLEFYDGFLFIVLCEIHLYGALALPDQTIAGYCDL